MNEEEAIIEMNLLGHDFFVFKNLNAHCIMIICLKFFVPTKKAAITHARSLIITVFFYAQIKEHVGVQPMNKV